MPKVASNFGKYLGPRGKMPSPKQGLIKDDVKKLKEKFDKLVKIRSYGSSVKLSVGKEDMGEEKIAENLISAYNEILKEWKEIKNVLIKLTMSKPVKLENG
jgi:ribosomal protein L1